MDILKKYTIAYKGLSAGNHPFEFDVDDRFFAAFEGSDILKGNAHVDVDLTKGGNVIPMHITIRGQVWVACDRCLEEVEIPIEYTGMLCVRFSETEQESDGEIMWISPNETEINLAQYIYESIYLSLPYQRIHPVDENGKSMCNPDMLKRFRIVSEEEFEKITGDTAQAQNDTGDGSPWSKLAEFKTNLESDKKEEQ